MTLLIDNRLEYAPCGFLTLTTEGNILSVNQTLKQMLGYNLSEHIDGHVNSLLSGSARFFFQLYFFPIITKQKEVGELYLSLKTKEGNEVPVLSNASISSEDNSEVINCVFIPIHRRNEYENQLLIARKAAEDALKEKNKAHRELEETLDNLKVKQAELFEANKKNQRYKIYIQQELQLAKKVQHTSLPSNIKNDKIKMDSHYKASKELSGDIYGFYQVSDHKYGIILLDVMGHGISSALITMSLQALFHRLISKGASTDTVMKELDNHLHHLFQSYEDTWHYCTAIYLLIDTKQQTVEYANAGHPPAVFQDTHGDQHSLSATTPPLGTFKRERFKTNIYSYTSGSRLLLYTDGVSEPLQNGRLNSLLQEYPNSSAGELKTHILHTLAAEGDKQYKKDDQCFIIVDLM